MNGKMCMMSKMKECPLGISIQGGTPGPIYLAVTGTQSFHAAPIMRQPFAADRS